MSDLQRFWEGVPWWVGVLILGGLLLYAFARASYEEYLEVEKQRDALQKRVKALEDQPHPRQPSELKALCIHLSRDVAAFAHARSSMPGSEIRSRMDRAETEAELKAMEAQGREAIRQHDEETVKRYHAKHRPAIMDLYGELAPRWFHEGDKELFENLSDWTQLEEVAQRLETVGERLPDR